MTDRHSGGIAVNLISFGPRAGLDAMLDACVRHGIDTVTPWGHHFAEIGAVEAARRIRARGMRVNGLCRLAGFAPAGDAEAFRAAVAEGRSMLETAADMEAGFVVVTGGGLPPGSTDIAAARARVAQAMAELAPLALRLGVGLGLEPLHPMFAPEHGPVSTLAQALDICDAAGPGSGIVLDTYHVWWDPDLYGQIARAGTRTLAFQVADWMLPTVRTTHSRGMPGEGIIDNSGIHRRAAEAGFAGPVELELFSAEDWWLREPDVIAAAAVQCLADWR